LAQEAIPQDPKSLIRLFVARNPSTPPAVLAQLAQDAEIANWLVLDNPSVLLEDL
jgi:leucine rich repeat (LRR) protein